MIEKITIISFILALYGFILSIVAEFLPKDQRRKYYLAVVLLVIFTIITYLLNLSRIMTFYNTHVKAIANYMLVISIILAGISLRFFLRSMCLKKEHFERIMSKEYIKIDKDNPFVELIIDAKKHCGRYYFNGKCLLLPKGSYQVTPNPSNPGGWSAWNKDNIPNTEAVIGPWTWKVFISIPGLTEDFADVQYHPNESYKKAWQLGPVQDWWRYRCKEDIKKSIFASNEFPIKKEFCLDKVSPVWFWIWDQKPADNRGEIRLFIYKTG